MTDALKDEPQQDPNDPFGKVEYATTHVYFDAPRKQQSKVWQFLLLPFRVLAYAFRALFFLFDMLEKTYLVLVFFSILIVAPLLLMIYFHSAAIFLALGILQALFH